MDPLTLDLIFTIALCLALLAGGAIALCILYGIRRNNEEDRLLAILSRIWATLRP